MRKPADKKPVEDKPPVFKSKVEKRRPSRWIKWQVRGRYAHCYCCGFSLTLFVLRVQITPSPVWWDAVQTRYLSVSGRYLYYTKSASDDLHSAPAVPVTDITYGRRAWLVCE